MATTSIWATAIPNCNGLGLAGKSWRLPNVQELKTIVDTTTTASAKIDGIAFPSTVGDIYWSSTTSAQATSEAWYIGFVVGNISPTVKTNPNYVRCVTGQ